MSVLERERRGRRDVIGVGVALLNRLAKSRTIDRLGWRRQTERVVFEATKSGFRTAGALSRSFSAASKLTKPARLPAARGSGRFDLTPTEDQQTVVEVVREFAAEVLRPAAPAADTACTTEPKVLTASAELGLSLIEIPEELGGFVTERSAMTGVLVAEALSHGDMGQAVACLAPAAVSTAISLWGDETQQATYLPAFTGDSAPPAAALAILEPRPLFDPFELQTRVTNGKLTGVKSLVPRGAEAELFVIAAQLDDQGPALFLVESGHPGITIEAEPSMGLRAASLSRVILDDVPAVQLGTLADYADCVRLSRLGWCALALGTAQAVLDYVTPYVNERTAFGEPISHRQSVAFMVANIAIELEGMRLVTYRAGSRAEQGLPFAREVALARKLCADRGMQIGTDGVQLLGGHGYVKEHPVERWYRDLRAIGVMEGAVLL
ncbi:acyl-CoA dehydrogenase family protein [Kribbella sandramycini]|uniref:Alkylation response protein AidB-like acyl-CoA dehydrogenase n=1 Tax=Kribbella sandramycini TaxID=60450 RepID=A0A841SEE9_9ACTN|nr:acyl-CoA dehydrogenase family protein [Kribbella sandramycini]MBB6570368.1 alkylation response protein AidB-like acyl-CoA dehydrogenase [Kribbella sandramycini]